jgi:hypothetical protein
MSDSTSRQHATGGPPSDRPPVPEPTFAERVRTLIEIASVGTLSTQSKKHQGFPFGSLAPYALDPAGRPLFLFSSMAVHAQNLIANPHASLLIPQPQWKGEPLAAARATLMGTVAACADDERTEARERYLQRHPNSRHWVNFDDFAFYRMEPADIYFVAGFGAMGWVSAADYLAAEADPLAESAPQILEHMNADHADALQLLGRVHGSTDVQEATLTAVDRLGFQLRLGTRERTFGIRIAFPQEVRSSDEARKAFITLIEAARRQ